MQMWTIRWFSRRQGSLKESLLFLDYSQDRNVGTVTIGYTVLGAQCVYVPSSTVFHYVTYSFSLLLFYIHLIYMF